MAFKDTDGFWTLGGYGATQGASGLIGPTRIYRLQVVRPEQVSYVLTTNRNRQ